MLRIRTTPGAEGINVIDEDGGGGIVSGHFEEQANKLLRVPTIF